MLTGFRYCQKSTSALWYSDMLSLLQIYFLQMLNLWGLFPLTTCFVSRKEPQKIFKFQLGPKMDKSSEILRSASATMHNFFPLIVFVGVNSCILWL